jgi:hypothetical protein
VTIEGPRLKPATTASRSRSAADRCSTRGTRERSCRARARTRGRRRGCTSRANI